MASHKPHVGEIVSLRPVVSRNVPGGAYEVTKPLPHNGREFEYRITRVRSRGTRARRSGKRTDQGIAVTVPSPPRALAARPIGNPTAYQIGGHRQQRIGAALGLTVFDRQVPAIDEAAVL